MESSRSKYPSITLRFRAGFDRETRKYEELAIPLDGHDWGFDLECPACGKPVRIEEQDYSIRLVGNQLTLSPVVACPHAPCRWAVHVRASRVYSVGEPNG